MNKNIKAIDNQAIRALMSHKWKGEVRELENIIERTVIFCSSDFITLKDLPPNFQQQGELTGALNTGSLEEAVRNYEKDLIVKALESNEFSKEKTAEALQVGLSTLYRKLKELDIKS
jgi:transcriptional regulator with PAS, ATPase and Fis domain